MKTVHDIKTCTSCKLDIPITQFYFQKGKPVASCKGCTKRRVKDWARNNRPRMNERNKAWFQANKEKVYAYRKEWNSRNKDKVYGYRKKWVAANPDKDRNRRLMYSTGITLQQYEAMLKAQHGVCAICSHISEDGRQLCVDHCHKTGKIRGLLCTHCNTAIGLLKDDLTRLQKAINYLSL